MSPDQSAEERIKVAVLFARSRSNYFLFPQCEVYDRARDARRYKGTLPVIAHPPCRLWGNLSHMAKPQDACLEKELAHFAVDEVRRCGGVLEHPSFSKLWAAAGLPKPGARDKFGGWTLPFFQGHCGHSAPKATWLYVAGVEPRDAPSVPFGLSLPPGRIEQLGKAARESTPVELCSWLIGLASICSPAMDVSP